MKELTDSDFDTHALAALDRMDHHVLLTGRAGTGKTTILNHWLETRRPVGVAVLAPTGMAALNAHGETIHHYLHVQPGLSPREMMTKGRESPYQPMYEATRIIVIDEISMCRSDLMDGMDMFLRGARRNSRPFGGIRLIMVGDPLQLPPVVPDGERSMFHGMWKGPWWFQSNAYRKLIELHAVTQIDLERVYRQHDPLFIRALNSIRSGRPAQGALQAINRAVGRAAGETTITLTGTNRMAQTINQQRLDRLDGPLEQWEATVEGDWDGRTTPAPRTVACKPGARIMMLNNDPNGTYVNGSMGTFLRTENDLPVIRLDDGTVTSTPIHQWIQWESYAYRDMQTGTWKLGRRQVGSYRQVPFKLGWAITIHKSQGMTFDHVRIELDETRPLFANGQAYVALSRCRTLDGLSLNRALTMRDVHADPAALNWMRSVLGTTPTR